MTPFISKVGMDTRESAFVAIRLRLKAERPGTRSATRPTGCTVLTER